MFIQLHLDGITIRISHCKISQRQDIPWLFPVILLLFSTIVLHTRSYRTWIVQNLIALSSNEAFKRDTSSLRSASFPCGIMRLTLPAKTRKLPKAGMFRHKRFLLASQCHVSGKTSLRVYVLIIHFSSICARISRKRKNSKFRRYSSIDRLDSFGNSQDIDSLYYYLEEYFLVCFEKSLCCKVKHKDIKEKKILNKFMHVFFLSILLS